MPQKPTASDLPAQTFETAIERLEQIVEEMEGDKLPLEQLLERYEEGSKLVKVCQEKLESAERRVEILTRNASGKPQAVPFEPQTAPPPPPAEPVIKKKPVTGDVSLF